MAISRRKFLQAGTVFAIAAGIPLKTGVVVTKGRSSVSQASSPGETATTPAVKSDAVSLYTKSVFAAHLNSTFVIKSHRVSAVGVKLVEVKDAGPVPDRRVAGRECFVLHFRGPHKLKQDVYTIEHAALGKFDLLLVPIGKDKSASYYEALINRLN